jgi:hypothetical protein
MLIEISEEDFDSIEELELEVTLTTREELELESLTELME